MLFNMGPTFLFSKGVELLRKDGYLTLFLLTHGNLRVIHRLLKFVDPISNADEHAEIESHYYTYAAS